MTVFIVPPRNVGLKGRNQFVGTCEDVVALLAFVVPMFAFACFVVVPEDALGLSLPGARSMAASIAAWLVGNFLEEPVDFIFLGLSKADDVKVVGSRLRCAVQHLRPCREG